MDITLAEMSLCPSADVGCALDDGTNDSQPDGVAGYHWNGRSSTSHYTSPLQNCAFRTDVVLNGSLASIVAGRMSL